MKSFAIALSTIFLTLACSAVDDETEVSFSNLGSEEYPQMFYMEYVPCQEGVYYTAENFRNDVLPEWQDLLVEVNSPLVSAYGIQRFERLSSDNEDGFWQLIWNSKADAEAAWKVWNENENVAAWTEDTVDILSCDGEKKFSFDAYIARANNTFGEFETTSFVSEYHQCLYKEGKEGADLREVIAQLETFLDSADSLPGPFSYVILGPDYETDEVDFFWGNFYQSEEARQTFDAEWQKLDPDVEDSWNMVTGCEEPRYYNSGIVPTS
tara:strand:+ start:7021 stop:7821 length:801 start_codon:yes stop_codon:yes gene_type:complete